MGATLKCSDMNIEIRPPEVVPRDAAPKPPPMAPGLVPRGAAPKPPPMAAGLVPRGAAPKPPPIVPGLVPKEATPNALPICGLAQGLKGGTQNVPTPAVPPIGIGLELSGEGSSAPPKEAIPARGSSGSRESSTPNGTAAVTEDERNIYLFANMSTYFLHT